jgi:hypothetical protein
MVDERTLWGLVARLDQAGPDAQPECQAIVSPELGALRHAPRSSAGNLHSQIKLLANPNDLLRRFRRQGESSDSSQKTGRTANLRHWKYLDLHAPTSAGLVFEFDWDRGDLQWSAALRYDTDPDQDQILLAHDGADL